MMKAFSKSREEGEERHPTSEGEQDAPGEEDSTTDLKEENEALKLQVEKLTDLLRKEKEKRKEAWRLSCQQLAEYDDVLVSKEEEIEVLKSQVKEVDSTDSTERSTYFSLPPTLEESRRPLDMMRVSRVTRKGKAPPVDSFTGEDPEVQFEDWLPTLERTAVWNGWTDEESLIQLAGHLRGRALIEWNLLANEDTQSFEKATQALGICLDSGSKAIVPQDFRHTMQQEKEAVSDSFDVWKRFSKPRMVKTKCHRKLETLFY